MSNESESFELESIKSTKTASSESVAGQTSSNDSGNKDEDSCLDMIRTPNSSNLFLLMLAHLYVVHNTKFSVILCAHLYPRASLPRPVLC